MNLTTGVTLMHETRGRGTGERHLKLRSGKAVRCVSPSYIQGRRCQNRKAVCGETRKHGLGRDGRKRSARNLAYRLLYNILTRFLARLEPHTDDSVWCAEVFTAIEMGLKTFDSI